MVTLFVAGTDTDVGKTVFAAGLVGALGAAYWKPIQSGLDGETDSDTVRRLVGRSAAIMPERYRLREPLSPHRAAELDSLTIDVEALAPPAHDGRLVIEGAGGVLVPVTRDTLYADLLARWSLPVVLCARTSLGTISHSLLSIEALRARNVAILGVAFVGDANEDSEMTITAIGRVKRLGRLPRLDPLTPEALRDAFAASFDLGDFERTQA